MDPLAATRRSRDLIVGVVLALAALGLVVVYSAVGGSTTDLARADRAMMNHSGHLLIGLALMAALSILDYHRLVRLALPLLVINAVMLVAVYFSAAVKGSHRWLILAGISFQPSELTKLVLVLYLATYLASKGDEVKTFRVGFMYPTLTVGLVCGLIFFERDLGTSVVIAAVAYLVMICAGTRFLYVGGLACVSMPLLLAVVRHSEYQWRRIVTFLDPWAYADSTGYQCIQSLIALGSGGWLGLGLGNGRHKLLFVPETRADSVFCIIGEELGFVGAALVIVAFLLLLREGTRVALRAPDKLGSLLAFGITMMIGIQAAVNIAVVTVSVPTKGIPLPLVSAGGSSLVLGLTGLGVLLNVAKQGVPTEPVEAPGGALVLVPAARHRPEPIAQPVR